MRPLPSRPGSVALTGIVALVAALVVALPAAAGTPGSIAVTVGQAYVSGHSWVPGDVVTITLDSDADPTNGVRDTQQATADGDGTIGVQLDVAVEVGATVTADAGGGAVTHTVVALSVTDVDVTADTVTGTGPAGATIDVFAFRHDDTGHRIQPEGEARDVPVSASGAWTADLGAGGYDLTRLDSLEVAHTDDDGDATLLYPQIPVPSLTVLPVEDTIMGFDWLPGQTLTLVVDDDTTTGNGVLFRLDDVVVDASGVFDEHVRFDVATGQHVTVTGDVSKHVEVVAIHASVDRVADTVTGTTSGDGDLKVDVYDGTGEGQLRWVFPDAQGRFAVDFSVSGDGQPPYDLTDQTNVGVGHVDGNQDVTVVSLPGSAAGPGPLGFDVAVRTDTVTGHGWGPNATVRVQVDDDTSTSNGTLQEVITTASRLGDLDTELQYDVRPGHVVTVSDGTTTRTHTVLAVTVRDVDRGADVVTGTADPGARVHVTASDQTREGDSTRPVDAAGDGTWTASFLQRLDLTTTTDVVARRYDDDGDSTSDRVPAPNPVLAGDDRDETAVAISRATFGPGEADAVVLARSDAFPDALSGTPFAIAVHAPLLLTATDTLSEAAETELQRVLDAGRTVHLLGGATAISDAVARRVAQLGYTVDRVAGPTRYETAVAIADRIPDPQAVLLTTGLNFPDGLAAGAVAPRIGGVVLLTQGDAPASPTASWLAAHPQLDVIAVGGPAARAHPEATPIVGATREDTALAVARRWFPEPLLVGIARSGDFPDALAGGVHIAWAEGPMLLTPSTQLHPGLASYLREHATTIDTAFAYGGSAALSPDVLDDIVRLIGD